MIVDVKMPKLGESLTEGTIIKWWKKVGETVEKDETILEVSTDKVDSEIPSPVAGVLVEILGEQNQTVQVDEVIARVQTEKEPGEKVTQVREDAKVSEKPEKKEELPKEALFAETSTGAAGRFYSPLVLNIARREGIPMAEVEKIPGRGRGGRVTKKDILDYLNTRSHSLEKGAPAGTIKQFKAGQRELLVPADPVLKKMAAHMRESLDTSAHVYSVSECDMTPVMNLITTRRQAFFQEEGFKLTVTPFFLHAVTRAILDFPRINCSFDGENIKEKRYINLGIAVAAEKGLIVPVIKNAEERNFRGLARAVNDIVSRTRKNKLTIDDVQGSTFTITNYGIFGNILGLPIINQPNMAILGVGAIKKRPVVIEGSEGDSIGIRSMVYISMSYDHRIIDGELGGRFLQRLVQYLEEMEPDIF